MLGSLIGPEVKELIQEKRWDVLRDVLSDFDPPDIAEILIDIPEEHDPALFRLLPRHLAGRVFSYLPLENQEKLIRWLSNDQMRTILREMTPDDQARLLEELPAEVTRRILETLSPDELKSARDLLGYPPETAGRYMTPQYVALRPDMTAREALEHVRRTGRGKETLNILYIIDRSGKLLEEVRLGSLVLADPETRVVDIEDRPRVSILSTADREEVLRAFEKYDRVALPVVDKDGHMLGIITADDVLDVAEQEATEDIQKIGGMEALDAPYPEVGFFEMSRKRGVWLSVLFVGEMATAGAIGFFEDELARAVVLTLFMPLITSSGGNSGSQASTLIVRSLALEEVRLRDWFWVLGREIRSGLALGSWLGFLGFFQIETFQHFHLVDYGPYHLRVALTVWLSLIGVVTLGTLAGSMLPFLLRRIGLDPATSSAPFVATIVDVSGLVIYFTVALLLLKGTLL